MITQVIQHPEYVTVKEIEVILNKYAKKVTREVEVKYYRTDFIADSAEDVEAANAEGSEYFKYPAGSTIYDADNKKVYILNASRTEYKEG